MKQTQKEWRLDPGTHVPREKALGSYSFSIFRPTWPPLATCALLCLVSIVRSPVTNLLIHPSRSSLSKVLPESNEMCLVWVPYPMVLFLATLIKPQGSVTVYGRPPKMF